MDNQKILVRKAGLFFLIWPLLCYVFIVISFIANWHISPLQLLLSFILTFVFINKGLSLKTVFNFSFIITLLIFFTYIISVNVYDPSFDGQVYHAATIKMLAEGWNPFYDPILRPDQLPYNIEPDMAIWSSHYGKGMEIVQAAMVNITGQLESGKIFNLWLGIALFLLSYDFLYTTVNIRNKSLCCLISFLVMSNPVLISQLFTYYIDFSSYVFVCLAIILYFNILTTKNLQNQFALYLICFFVPAIKFNISALFIVILLASVGFIYLVYKKYKLSLFFSCVVITLSGFIIGAYNPYISNIIYKNNIFYPLMGEDSVDIITDNTPLFLRENNRFYQVNASLISNPNNDTEISSMGNPFNISGEIIRNSGGWDTRLGGFGVFFFEGLVLLIVIFLTLPKDRWWFAYSGAILFIYLTLFLFPAGFWARYVAYYFMTVIILVVYILKWHRNKYQFYGAILSTWLLIINGLISLGSSSYLIVSHKLKTDYLVSKVNRTNQNPIKIHSRSVTLLDKLNSSGKDVITNMPFNPKDTTETVKVYPFPEIVAFPELYLENDGNRIINSLGYKNIVFQPSEKQ